MRTPPSLQASSHPCPLPSIPPLQKHRNKVFAWLNANPSQRDAVMEAIVTVLTGAQGLEASLLPKPGLVPRKWQVRGVLATGL